MMVRRLVTKKKIGDEKRKGGRIYSDSSEGIQGSTVSRLANRANSVICLASIS
jgi:hypothetical protein